VVWFNLGRSVNIGHRRDSLWYWKTKHAADSWDDEKCWADTRRVL